MPADRDARVRDRAYQIWLSEGRRHGRDKAHWHQAERDIDAEDAAAGGKRPSAATEPVTSQARPATVSRAQARDEAAAAPAPDSPERAGEAPPRSRRAAAKT